MSELYTLHTGDCKEVLATLQTASVDAVVTDPPAGISFMGKSWDSDKGGRRQWIAWLTEVMEEALRVIKPGGHALVWALPRTSHWTATALEDAGWDIRDICTHHFGSGFPKSLNLGDGRGTALKPASEHWILARAPIDAPTIAANMLKYGTGGLNVDACRVGADITTRSNNGGNDGANWRMGVRPHTNGSDSGRWPANLLLTCCGEDPHLDGCPVAEMDHQSGERNSGLVKAGTRRSNLMGFNGAMPAEVRQDSYGDRGGASRFFAVFKPDCWLCGGLRPGIMNVTHNVHKEPECPPANGATENTHLNGANNVSAQDLAQQNGLPDFAGSKNHSSISAPSAEAPLPPTRVIDEPTALKSVGISPLDLIAQRVQSAANLCEQCATAIAPALAVLRRNPSQVSIAGWDFMPEPRRLILFRSLALLAESLGSIDTTPTIASLKMWCGYVRHAIESSIAEITTASCLQQSPPLHKGSPSCLEDFESRFRYQSKPDRAERDAGLTALPHHSGGDLTNRTEGSAGLASPRAGAGRTSGGRNTHPTVKPVELMRYLCRLITPPGGIVLDPFMGSGTTGAAALAEGFRFIGIDLQPEYVAIAEARLQRLGIRQHTMFETAVSV